MSGKRIPHRGRWICISIADLTERPNPGPSPKCQHTPCPTGYGARAEWAEKMMKTHRQRRCPFCGLWAIWEKKSPRATRQAVSRALKGMTSDTPHTRKPGGRV